MPKPRGILIVSAHWESAPMMLSASAAATPLVYDFGGFHPRYYQMTYPTPDAGGLARRVAAILPDRDGFMTHGLPFLTREMLTGGVVPSWSADFDAWAADALNRGDVDTLTAYRSKAPGMPYAHPTVDHYIPLFITLGAAEREDQPVDTIIEGYMAGLSRRSFQVN
jgi:4,5-DOPA dioxygenase extradiol